MLTSHWLRPALATLLAVLSFSPPVAAAIQLQVDAPPECTTREELIARVAARNRQIELVAPGRAGPAPATVRVVVTPGTRAVAGELTITQPASAAAVRRLSAPSCEQLTDALALLIALAFDPAAPAEQDQAPPPQVAPPRPEAPPPPKEPAHAPAPLPAGPPPGRLRLSAAVGGQVLSGPAPRAMPGVIFEVTLGWDRASVWSPAARLSTGLDWSGALHEIGGDAAFSLASLTLDACPLRLLPWKVEARACATGTIGRLGASGSQTFDPAPAERPFAATGGAAVLTLSLGSTLELAARGSVAASWIRDSFAFAPKIFYRGAPLFLSAGLTAGVRFR